MRDGWVRRARVRAFVCRFTSRVSACGLFKCAYARVDTGAKSVLRALFIKVGARPCAASALCCRRVASAWCAAGLTPARRLLSLQLCRDDTPMVRRSACQHLGDFARLLQANEIIEDVMPVVTKLASDDQDSVRLLAVDATAVLGTVLPAAVKSSMVCGTESHSLLFAG